MGIREKKKFKNLLPWGEAKSDKTGTDGGREKVGSGGSPARPVPHVVASSGHDRGGNDDESNSNWRSTTSAAAKLLLRGVKDSAAAFGPLQSVAGALCFILDNCEVRSYSWIRSPQYLQVSQKTKANKRAIESLAPRVKAIADSLYMPVPEGDIREESRRKILER